MTNVCVLQGRFVADPELKTTGSGTPVTTFRLAVDRSYTPKGEERKADFIDITAWRNTAEFACKYFAKGDLCIASGSLQTRNYEDKNGNKRTAYEVVASEINFCGGKKDEQGGVHRSSVKSNVQSDKPATEQNRAQSDDYTLVDDNGDLPF